MYMYTYKRYETTDNALIERSLKQQNDISILTSLFFSDRTPAIQQNIRSIKN